MAPQTIRLNRSNPLPQGLHGSARHGGLAGGGLLQGPSVSVSRGLRVSSSVRDAVLHLYYTPEG